MKRMSLMLAVAVSVAVAGCGKKAEEKLAEKLIEKRLAKEGVKAKVDVSGETMTLTATDEEGKPSKMTVAGDEVTFVGPDGTTTFRAMGEGKMPADFPPDVYLQEGASIVASVSSPAGVNLTLKSSAPKADVVSRYTAEMKAKGWTPASSMDMGEMAMLAFEKGSRKANVLILTEDGATSINLAVVQE